MHRSSDPSGHESTALCGLYVSSPVERRRCGQCQTKLDLGQAYAIHTPVIAVARFCLMYTELIPCEEIAASFAQVLASQALGLSPRNDGDDR